MDYSLQSDLLINFLTFLLGLLLGNWLAIGRDRRREFNEAAQPLREWLLSEIDSPSAYRERPSPIEIDTFVSCLSWWRRGRFRAALERQDQVRRAAEKQSSYGEVQYSDDSPIKAALRDCLSFTERR